MLYFCSSSCNGLVLQIKPMKGLKLILILTKILLPQTTKMTTITIMKCNRIFYEHFNVMYNFIFFVKGNCNKSFISMSHRNLWIVSV